MLSRSDAPWPPGTTDAIGQAAEFLVWATLIEQSRGGLHVFLPVLDRGIDALVHRIDDGAYIAVQVKAKTSVQYGEAPIAVYQNHLFTDDQLVVGVHLDHDHLGPFILVADAATFKAKAARMVDRGRVMLVADMPVGSIAGHKWSENMLSVEDLAKRLGASRLGALPAPPGALEMPSEEDRVTGSWGELEVSRRLAMVDDSCVFRPFPDNEVSEIVVRRLATAATLGIQVKTAHLDEPHAYRHVLVNRSNFVASPSTLIVVVAWIVPERRFHPTSLVIPTEDLPSIAGTSGPYYELHFRPDGSSEPSVVDRYRFALDSLTEVISRRLG